MSMPIIQRPENPIDREQSVNDLIESVAMMEAGLSHVINAEGEKIQKVADPDADYPLDDIVAVNNSAEKMINTISKLEMMLQSKLETTKDFDTGTTPSPTPITEESGAIVQYCGSISMNTNLAGLPGDGAILAFQYGGTSTYEVDLNGNAEEFEHVQNYATFPMPRNGILTSASVSFYMVSTATAETQVIGRVYVADSLSDTFHPLAGTMINLTPVVPVGGTAVRLVGSVENLNVPITANSRVAFLIYSTSNTTTSTSGTACASINIQ